MLLFLLTYRNICLFLMFKYFQISNVEIFVDSHIFFLHLQDLDPTTD